MVQKEEVRYIICLGRRLEYRLTRKSVKNINLRIKPDGSIHISAHPRVPLAFIEDMIQNKQDFIFRALERFEEQRQHAAEAGELKLQNADDLEREQGSQRNQEPDKGKLDRQVSDREKPDRQELGSRFLTKYPPAYQRQVFEALCEEIYLRFRRQGYQVPYPTLKIRYMTSRWGSCQPQKGIITLNSLLMEKTPRCMEYVVVHEFAHFIQPNHSRAFYQVVEEFLPDWKERKKELNER